MGTGEDFNMAEPNYTEISEAGEFGPTPHDPRSALLLKFRRLPSVKFPTMKLCRAGLVNLTR